jgi:uncharacterized membrane protein
MAPAIVLGILAAPGLPGELADDIEDELPALLAQRFPGTEWVVRRDEEPPAETVPQVHELIGSARRRLLDEDWHLVICLTELPLRAGRRPVTAHASATQGVGLLSVPALGVRHVKQRALDAIVHLIEGLVGESLAEGVGDESRTRRIAARLGELAAVSGDSDDRTIRFVASVVRGNLRLLLGMLRANRPWRLAMRLTRSLASALGVSAIAIASSNVWELADGMTWPRLLGVMLLSLASTCAALIVAHDLWERSSDPRDRERVVLFNTVTVLTVMLGVFALYAMMFVLTLAGAGSLIPPSVLEHAIGDSADVTDYLRLTWLITSLATIGGALGSLIESDVAVREAAYGYRPDARTESADG